MRVITYRAARPGPGWHAHGTTSKVIAILSVGRLEAVRLVKQRWLHVDSGTTRHDRPPWDPPGRRYGLDVVLAIFAVWLVGAKGLHAVDWPWAGDRPARRTVQRHAAALAPHADDWLDTARKRIIDFVAPRHLEEILPAGGIPPPRGRTRNRQSGVLTACKLRDIAWIHDHVARAYSIPIRRLLGVARWRWPSDSPAPA